MLATELTTDPKDDLIDEFDLDIRISVLPNAADISAGFSTWQTCKSTCVSSCYCSAGGSCDCSFNSVAGCC